MNYIISNLICIWKFNICKRNYFGGKESNSHLLVIILLQELSTILNILLGTILYRGMMVLMYLMKSYKSNYATV